MTMREVISIDVCRFTCIIIQLVIADCKCRKQIVVHRDENKLWKEGQKPFVIMPLHITIKASW